MKRVGTRAGCPGPLNCGCEGTSLVNKGSHNLIVQAYDLRPTCIFSWNPRRTYTGFELLNDQIDRGGDFATIKATNFEIGNFKYQSRKWWLDISTICGCKVTSLDNTFLPRLVT